MREYRFIDFTLLILLGVIYLFSNYSIDEAFCYALNLIYHGMYKNKRRGYTNINKQILTIY